MRSPVSLATLGTAAALLAALGTSPSALAAGDPTVTLDAGITPAFETGTLDYVTRCSSKTGKVSVRVSSPSGTTVKVDRAAAKSGRQTVSVPLTRGQRFSIVVKAAGKTTTHAVRCLPGDFPKFTSTGRLPAGSPFMTFAQLRPLPNAYMVVVDSRGTPVWWLKTSVNSDVKAVGKGKIGTWIGKPLDGNAQAGLGHFYVYSLAGKRLQSVTGPTDIQDNHESLQAANGDWYVINYDKREHVNLTAFGAGADSSVYDARIRRVSPTGATLWTWSSKDRIALAETGPWWNTLKESWKVFGGFGGYLPNVTTYDAVHANSIEEDGKGGLIVSFRHLNAVYRIDASSGEIDWKLGGTFVPGKSLTVLGDDANAQHLIGQHDARVQPDGTITVFDNGWPLFEGGVISGHPSRAVRWQIDPVARTATLVEQVTDSEVPTPNCCGSARKLADGSWVIHWGVPYTRAYGPAPDHAPLFKLHMDDNVSYSYRSVPISSSQITRAQFLAGMDAQWPRR